MSTLKQQQQQQELETKLWKMVNDLRGTMEAYQFKDYILSVLFYRFLSDKIEIFVNKMLSVDNISYFEAWQDEEYRSGLIEYMQNDLGFVIEPQYLFTSLVAEINKGNFDIEMLQGAINSLVESTHGTKSASTFLNLFEDMDLTSTKLGREQKHKSTLMSKILTTIDSISFSVGEMSIDVLGNAYEYLISNFAATGGKKAGEFYTPKNPSRLLAKLVTTGLSRVDSVYDPTCGSGSLLLHVSDEVEVGHYYGQELTSTTYNLARMNMLLHGKNYHQFDIMNGDTIANDMFRDKFFDIQVANPPYSVNWSADDSFLDDERFAMYGALAPKSKGDFAFVQHMLYHMSEQGRAAVLLPHGVLFRGASEGKIRKHIIENLNYLDAVVGLPANLFYGTSIPVCALVFKKDRGENKGNVLFIDASRDFESGKNQNVLREEDIEKIVKTYSERANIDKYSKVVPIEEIRENDFNLNIPRYVDTFETEEQIDLDKVAKELSEVDVKLAEVGKELEGYFKELGL